MKLAKSGFFLCALALIASKSPAQTRIGSVTFHGASVFSRESLTEVFGQLGFFSSDTARISEGISNLAQQYYADGYIFFSVDSFKVIESNDTSTATLSVFITEGARVLVGRIIFHGNSFSTSDKILSQMETRVGRPFDQGVLEQDLDIILKEYNTNGYPLARISIDSIYVYGNPYHDSLGISIGITEGKRVIIDAVRLEGNTETKDYVILRALGIQRGAYYDEDQLTLARQRVEKLGFFQSVSEPELFERGDTTGILLKIVEGNTNTFDGVIGYVPGQQGQSGYFTGMIDISMKNLFGTGRKFRASWHQETKLTQQIEIGYSEPYVFGYPINAEIDFSQRQQDTTSVTRNLALNGVFMLGDYFTANFSVGNLSTTPLLNADDNYFVYESSVLNLGAGISYDSRNDVYSPTHGLLYDTQIQFGEKQIYGPQPLITPDLRLTNYVQHLSVDLSVFHQFIPRQILAVGLHGEQVTGTTLDQTDMYRLGGTNTIRGYVENQFLATKAAWTNIEYRFATGRESFMFGFVDAGYLFKQSDPVAKTPATSFSLYGYGVGAQVETGIGILKASFALGKGDSFVDGKIHFGIVNQF